MLSKRMEINDIHSLEDVKLIAEENTKKKNYL